MLTFVVIALLGLLSLLSISLQRTYNRVPRTELKRRAARGDEFAQALYRAAAFGASLQVLLWGLIGLFSAGFFVAISLILPAWLATILVLLILWLGFAWLPYTKVTRTGNYAAKTVSPLLARVLNQLYPLLSRVSDWFKAHGRIYIHTGLYEKDDLLTLLESQRQQPDNRISEQELKIAIGALTFSDRLISDVMTPRRAVKLIAAKDSIGPVLMTELHDSGFSRFPVYQDKEDNIVGTLHLRDLVSAKAGGQASELMGNKVFYVHDEQTLDHALQAFLKTKHHLFIVVNNFEEFVGVITIEDVLEEILGQQIVGEFDKFEDMRAVAQLEAKSATKARAGKPLE